MAWPTMSDYQETIQNPNTCFLDHELKNGTPILSNLGLPKPIAGGFACVYQMICGPHNYAVRCFLTKQLDLEKRYKIISDYLREINLPYMVGFEFISQGISVNGQWFPILKMEWINGEPLNIYLEKNLHKPQKLEALASNFKALIDDLRKYSIAHGDLQHENIIVSNEQLKLIDYDGLYVPGLETIPSNEYGHRNYQHPSRSEKDFGPNLDNFSAWIIYTSIYALRVNPKLWDQFQAGDGSIIFRKEDFLDPNQSLAFKLFEQSRLLPLQSLAKQLRIFLSFNDLARIPIIDAIIVAESNLPNISPHGLPAWLQDSYFLKTILINNQEPLSEGSSFNLDFLKINIPKSVNLILGPILIGTWVLGMTYLSITAFSINSIFLNIPILFSISFGLSSILGLWLKKLLNPNNDELQKCILKDSSVPGIGPQLILSLNKAGITTAADILNIHIVKNDLNPTKVVLIEVSGKGIIRIDGIGPVKARALLEWKNLMESNLKKPILLQTLQRNAIAKYKQHRNLLQKEIKQLKLEFAKRLQ